MKKGTLLTAIFLLCPLTVPADTIVLGRENAERDFAVRSGTVLRPGLRGFQDLELDDASGRSEGPAVSAGDDIDLLLHLDRPDEGDMTGRYRLESPAGVTITTVEPRLGEGSAVFRGEPLALHPGDDALFAPGTTWGDFTMEFWLRPSRLREGETIIEWKGLLDDGRAQEWTVRVRGRRLVWTFDNFFVSPDGRPTRIELRGDPLIPGEWRHHQLFFDADIGLLEYRIDGIPSDIAYATGTNRETPDIWFPRTGERSGTALRLGVTFQGMMDEFRLLSRTPAPDEPRLRKYPAAGLARTRIIDLGSIGSRLRDIDATVSTTPGSDIDWYYLLTDDLLSARNLPEQRSDRNRPDRQVWRRFVPGETEIDGRGRYLLIMLELFPDLALDRTPVVSDISIRYETRRPPPPPDGLYVETVEGDIHLSWRPSPAPEEVSYLVYWGHEPGRYNGVGSPANAGSGTSWILKTPSDGNRPFYFSVVAYYDRDDPASYSRFSPEIMTRIR